MNFIFMMKAFPFQRMAFWVSTSWQSTIVTWMSQWNVSKFAHRVQWIMPIIQYVARKRLHKRPCQRLIQTLQFCAIHSFFHFKTAMLMNLHIHYQQKNIVHSPKKIVISIIASHKLITPLSCMLTQRLAVPAYILTLTNWILRQIRSLRPFLSTLSWT